MASKVSGIIEKIQPNGSSSTYYAIASTAYGYCETTANEAAKVIDMTGFKLYEGVTVHIKFKYANTAARPTLNVNSTGAKAVAFGIMSADADGTIGWRADDIVEFTYDGTSWVVNNAAYATRAESVLANNVKPITTKTYNMELYNSSTGANFYQTFATVTPVNYNEMWIASYRITITASGHLDYTEVSYVSISGRANTYYSYYIYNSLINYPIYYHTYLPSSSASTSHELGYRMASSYGATDVQKVAKVELLEQTNCTVTLLDSLKLYTSSVPSGYYTWYNFNATSNGLQEAGDANDTAYYFLTNGFKGKVGANKIYRYCLFARTSDGSYESFVMQDNTRATTKTVNPHGFIPDGKIYWNSGNAVYNQGTLNFTPYEQYHAIDYLYSFNFNNTFLPDYCETYIVWTYNSTDGLLYLDTTQWLAAGLPTTADGKIYQRIGSKYYTGTSNYYQGSLLLNNPYYEYKNGAIHEWNGRAADAGTVNGHTVAVDVPSGAKFTDTTSFTITAAATDGLWDLTGTNGTNKVTYALAPFSAKQSAASFYTAATNPTLTTRLNYDGYLYATKLYSGGSEVLTSHRTYTAVSGKKPTGNQTPGFGSTFDIEQVGQDATGQVSVTERTVTIPNTSASASVAGLVDTSAQEFAGIKTFRNGIEIKGHIAGDSGGTGHGLWGGGGYHNAYNNIILHGDASTGSSGIAFVSDKINASTGAVTTINQPSDRAFIQYHACGITTTTVEGTAPTLATSGEAGRLVIGIGNDSGDKILLQAPGDTDIVHQKGATGYPIPHTTNTNGSVGGTTTPVYVEAGIIKAGTALGTASQKAESYFVKAITSTDNAIVRYDGTSGQVQDSGVKIDDNNNITNFNSFKYNTKYYPFIKEFHARTKWYKITFPYSTATTDSSNDKWFMNSFDLHFGGGYNANPSGVAHVTFYWTRAANNGAWTVGQQSALIEGTLVNKIGLYYRIAEPGILYVNNTANVYNGIWIDNLYVDDTSPSLDWSTITITDIADITESTSPKLSDYTKITTSYLYNDGGTLKTDSNFEGKYIKGTWLYTSAATAKTSTAKLATIESDNYIYYITPANALKSAVGTTTIGGNSTPIYWNGSTFTAGTALSDGAYKSILNNTSAGALGWDSGGNTNANNLRLINVNTLAYWNGAYSGTTSNLEYYKGGKFGTMAKETATDYAKLASPSFTGTPKSITPNADSDGTMIATKAYVDGILAANDALVYKGTKAGTSAATNGGTLMPAGVQGDTYKVSTAGYINGQYCEVGDMIICITDVAASTTSNYTTTRASWNIIQTSDGTVSTSETSVTENTIPRYSGTTGKFIKKTGVTIDDNNNMTIGGTIYFGGNTSSGKSILGFSSTYPKYGIWYKDDTNDIMSFSSSGNADSGISADLGIQSGKIYNKGKIIPHTGNDTGSVGGTNGPVYVDGGQIKACTTYANATVAKAGAANITTTKYAVTRYSNTTGTFANSTVTIDDSGNVSIPGTLKFTGLGEGLEFVSDNNYFGTNGDARIIQMVDTNPGASSSVVDGGIIIRAVGRNSNIDTTRELLRIRGSYNDNDWHTGTFQWKTKDIVVELGTTVKTWNIAISGNAGTATTATNLTNNPSLAAGTTDTDAITVTAGEKTSSEFTVPYATKASYLSVMLCRGGTNASNSGVWSALKNTITNAQTSKVNFYTIYNDGGPTAHGECLEILSYNANHWQPQLWFESGKTGHLYYRNKNYNDDSWGDWRKILDSGNTYAANSNGAVVSVARNTDTTIATINGAAIKIKIPASDNTWRPIGTGANDAMAGNTVVTNVSYTSATDSADYPVLIKNTIGSTTTASGVKFNTGVTINPNDSSIKASEFIGTLKSSNVKPTISKTYTDTNFYGTSDAEATCSKFFISIKPDSWYKPWQIRFKVRTYAPAHTNADSITWCTLNGRADGIIYANWNERYDIGHYYIVARVLKNAGFNAGLGHAVGVNIRYSTGRGNSEYYKTIELEYYDCSGCTVTVLDNAVLWSNWTNGTDTNYNGYSNLDAVNRGLRESSDDNDTQTIQSYYDRVMAGTNGIMQYSLAMRDSVGRWQSFTTTNGVGTTKTKNTVGFVLGEILYMSTGSNITNGNITGWGVCRHFQSLIDYRYSINAGNTLNDNSTLYIVGQMGTNGLFYLNDTWWATSLPTQNSNNIYIPIGVIYPDGANKTYRCDFSGWHTPLWYHDGNLRSYEDSATYIEGTNNAANPNGALLRSGAGRQDASTAGDTWLYWDTLGGTSTPWGIRHNQGNNTMAFIGRGTEQVVISMSESKVTATTFAGKATSAGTADTATTATNLSAKPSLAASGNNITVTAGEKTSDAFTVPYATSAGSANAVAWANVSGKPIEFITNTGALNTNGWKTLGGRSSGKKIAISYNNNAATWNAGTYSATLVYGCNDTKGMLDIAYNTPTVVFGGSAVNGSTDDNPTWYMKLQGTSEKTYTLPGDSKTLCATDGSNASGSWGISVTGSSGSCTGNAATATSISTTGGTSAKFWRGDNGWSNTLTDQLLIYNSTTGRGDSYSGGIQIREFNQQTTTCDLNWYNAPGITFHWGGRWANKLGIYTGGGLFWGANQVVVNTGSWGISVTGSSASCTGNATSATKANITSNKYGVAYYSDTAGTFATTAQGTSGYVLQAGGSDAAPSWINATNSNTGSTIVKRDSNGDFSARTITASLTGNASSATAIKVNSTATTKSWITGTSTTLGNSASTINADSLVYLTTTAGQMSATSYSINDGAGTPAEKVRLQWNSTDSSLDFIFA